MAVLTANFDLGVDGNQIATTDPGDATPWDSVTSGGGTSPEYDNAHSVTGTLSARIYRNTTGAALRWTSGTVGTQTEYYGRIYVYFTANPSSAFFVHQARRSGDTANSWALRVNTAGTLSLINAASSAIATSSNSITLNGWTRIEYHITHGTGAYEVRIFLDHTSETPTETLSATGAAFSTNIDTYYFAVSNVSGLGYWLDGVVCNATTWVGPFPVNTVAPVASGSPVVGQVLSVTDGTWNVASPTFTYQWQRDNNGGGVYGDIGGETANTYQLTIADLACNVRCVVTATTTTPLDTASANSNSLGPVTNPAPPSGGGTKLQRLLLTDDRQTIVLRGN